jgi:hypothetical protein
MELRNPAAKQIGCFRCHAQTNLLPHRLDDDDNYLSSTGYSRLSA